MIEKKKSNSRKFVKKEVVEPVEQIVENIEPVTETIIEDVQVAPVVEVVENVTVSDIGLITVSEPVEDPILTEIARLEKRQIQGLLTDGESQQLYILKTQK